MNPEALWDLANETVSPGPIVIKADDTSNFLISGEKIASATYYGYSVTGDLQNQISTLEKELRSMRSLLETVLKRMELLEEPEKVIKLREVPYGEAKKEIAKYFLDHDGEEIGYEELQDALRLDIKTIVAVCDEFVREGRIG